MKTLTRQFVVNEFGRKHNVELQNVKSAYRGRADRCCCGCAGKHFTPKENNTFVTRVFNKLRRNADAVQALSKSCFSYTEGNRVYVLYFS